MDDLRSQLIAARGEADELRHLIAGLQAAVRSAQQRAAVLYDELNAARAEVADLKQALKERGYA